MIIATNAAKITLTLVSICTYARSVAMVKHETLHIATICTSASKDSVNVLSTINPITALMSIISHTVLNMHKFTKINEYDLAIVEYQSIVPLLYLSTELSQEINKNRKIISDCKCFVSRRHNYVFALQLYDIEIIIRFNNEEARKFIEIGNNRKAGDCYCECARYAEWAEGDRYYTALMQEQYAISDARMASQDSLQR